MMPSKLKGIVAEDKVLKGSLYAILSSVYWIVDDPRAHVLDSGPRRKVPSKHGTRFEHRDIGPNSVVSRRKINVTDCAAVTSNSAYPQSNATHPVRTSSTYNLLQEPRDGFLVGILPSPHLPKTASSSHYTEITQWQEQLKYV